MGDEWAAISAFVVVVFVHAKRCVAQARPRAAHRVIGVWSTDFFEFLARVEMGDAQSAALVKSKRSPFVTRAVVACKQDECVVQLSCFFQTINNSAYAAINMFDHGGKDRHAVGEVLPAVLGEIFPRGILFATVPVCDRIIFFDGDK